LLNIDGQHQTSVPAAARFEILFVFRAIEPRGALMDLLKRRLANGDSAAFAELYDAIADAIFHYLVTQTGTREDAADLLQETFLRLYRAKDRLQDVDNLKAYCFRIAHNEMLRWSQSNHGQLATAEMLYEISDRPHPLSLDASDVVAHALGRLPTNYRQVVELKFFSRLTFFEISQVLGKPQGTVATWYQRAMEQLKTNLRQDRERGRL
jgi:RNA polymerase sigma-70 factor, ECF subfamily